MRREGEKEGRMGGGGGVGECAKGMFTSTEEGPLVPVYNRTQTHIRVHSDTHTSAC
jgi:hypothetical protein